MIQGGIIRTLHYGITGMVPAIKIPPSFSKRYHCLCYVSLKNLVRERLTGMAGFWNSLVCCQVLAFILTLPGRWSVYWVAYIWLLCASLQNIRVAAQVNTCFELLCFLTHLSWLGHRRNQSILLPYPSLHGFIYDCLIIDAKFMNHPTFQFQDTETSDTILLCLQHALGRAV